MAKKAKKAAASPRGAHGKRDVLRDAIAIEAMQAMIASRGYTASSDAGAATMLARSAYLVADAMMSERTRGDEPSAV